MSLKNREKALGQPGKICPSEFARTVHLASGLYQAEARMIYSIPHKEARQSGKYSCCMQTVNYVSILWLLLL